MAHALILVSSQTARSVPSLLMCTDAWLAVMHATQISLALATATALQIVMSC